MLRARTTCIYCGERISGNASDALYSPYPDTRRLLRAAARITCRTHARPALNDPLLPFYWETLSAAD